MGGAGSGRRSGSGKRTTEDHRSVDVRVMQREGDIVQVQPNVWMSGRSVTLDWTDFCGGLRAWFQCPICNRRIALLYFTRSGDVACRHCLNLSYQSQRESAGDRASRKANAIRRTLGWQPGILNPEGKKPPRMHWYRYWRLRQRYYEAAEQVVANLARFIHKFRI